MSLIESFERLAQPGAIPKASNHQPGERRPGVFSARGVKYKESSKNPRKFRVRIGRKFKWEEKLDWRNPEVDSDEIHQRYKREWKAKGKKYFPALPRNCKVSHKWHRSLIWVLKDGNFFSHVPKNQRFHHSSLANGEVVDSAGMWIIKKGVLQVVAPLSGHYKPSLLQFLVGIAAMKKFINEHQPALTLYHRREQWQEIPYEKWKRMTVAECRENYVSNPANLGNPNDPILQIAGNQPLARVDPCFYDGKPPEYAEAADGLYGGANEYDSLGYSPDADDE